MSYNEKDMEEYWTRIKSESEAREAITKRMDIIGQNGNDGLHYESKDKPPQHYDFDIQPWDYMESLFSEEGFCGFLEGNVIKYISRWRDKNGVEDLKKAQTYLNKLIEFADGE